MIKLERVEGGNHQLEQQLAIIRDEQTKIISNYYNLEYRYKEILQENKWIKNEILDLRKLKEMGKYTEPNFPLNKSQNFEKKSDNKDMPAFTTPNKVAYDHRSKDIRYDHFYNNNYYESVLKSPMF